MNNYTDTISPLVRKPLILGNWKMHGSYDANSELINAILKGIQANHSYLSKEIGVCVPHVYLSHTEDLCMGHNLFYGAQDCSAFDKGAYTGDVSAAMLAELGVHYVLVGHSERRLYQYETSNTVALKAKQALLLNITPVICIGETLAQRESNTTFTVLTEQLQAVLNHLSPQEIERCVIAYEPVWAIGTGKTATPEQAQTVHAFLRHWLSQNQVNSSVIRLLYGGSIKPDNAASLLTQPDIDGGLIGGAALNAVDFLSIINSF